MSNNYIWNWNTTNMAGTATAAAPTTLTTMASGAGGGGSYTITPNIVNSNITAATNWTFQDPHPKALDVKGDMNITGDINLDGKSLKTALENIEKRLAILHPNKELEEKWERLKSLGNLYRELEQEILEKEEIWAKLKK